MRHDHVHNNPSTCIPLGLRLFKLFQCSLELLLDGGVVGHVCPRLLQGRQRSPHGSLQCIFLCIPGSPLKHRGCNVRLEGLGSHEGIHISLQPIHDLLLGSGIGLDVIQHELGSLQLFAAFVVFGLRCLLEVVLLLLGGAGKQRAMRNPGASMVYIGGMQDFLRHLPMTPPLPAILSLLIAYSDCLSRSSYSVCLQRAMSCRPCSLTRSGGSSVSALLASTRLMVSRAAV